MICPILQTHPAKVMLTTRTLHVVTTLILFNICLALWAWFCICFEPHEVFRFIHFLILPQFDMFTSARLVIFIHTFKAKSSTTLTRKYSLHRKFVPLYHPLTSCSRTPLDIPIAVCVLHGVPLHILFVIIYIISLIYLVW